MSAQVVIDLPPGLENWVFHKLGSEVTGVSKPSALAGQNQVWRIKTANGRSFILRCGSPERSRFSTSGIAIRRHLEDAGVVVPKSIRVSGDGEVHGFGVCEIMSIVDGDDLEIVWPTLSDDQAMQLAVNAGEAVMASVRHMTGHAEHPVSGFGFCRWGDTQPADTWWSWCAQWLKWVSRMGTKNGTIAPDQVVKVKLAMWDFRHLIDQISLENAKTFIWDVAERNVMVSAGAWSGLVDQDVVMVGDPMVAPALARVALERSGATWAQEYEQTWAAIWSVGTQEMKRASIYRALFALQMAAKGGRTLPDGRTEPFMPAGLVDKMIDEMQRTLHG
jgi:Phosphotransferase enzyme family